MVQQSVIIASSDSQASILNHPLVDGASVWNIAQAVVLQQTVIIHQSESVPIRIEFLRGERFHRLFWCAACGITEAPQILQEVRINQTDSVLAIAFCHLSQDVSLL